MLGLDSCWVALTFRKGKCQYVARPGEKLVCVIALGYGEGHGVPHKSKPLEALCRTEGPMPDWFRRGMEAALLAPTATNQQKFRFTLSGDAVRAESTGRLLFQGGPGHRQVPLRGRRGPRCLPLVLSRPLTSPFSAPRRWKTAYFKGLFPSKPRLRCNL